MEWNKIKSSNYNGTSNKGSKFSLYHDITDKISIWIKPVKTGFQIVKTTDVSTEEKSQFIEIPITQFKTSKEAKKWIETEYTYSFNKVM